jgi:hypothetical protein
MDDPVADLLAELAADRAGVLQHIAALDKVMVALKELDDARAAANAQRENGRIRFSLHGRPDYEFRLQATSPESGGMLQNVERPSQDFGEVGD